MKGLGFTPRTAPAAHVILSLPQPAGRLAAQKQSRHQAPPASWARQCRRCARLELRAEATGAASPPWKPQNARLVLEDGSVWSGSSFGATGTAIGEVVFNTSMSGYQVTAASSELSN